MKVMKKMSKTDPELPSIPALSEEQVRRLLTADYLEALAKMIRKGQITNFDIAWDQTLGKPVGVVEVDANVILAPLEVHVMQQMAEAQAKAERQIPYEDLTAEVAEHEKCDSPRCVACNNPNKA